MKCKKCGCELKEESRFCGECGERIPVIDTFVGESSGSNDKIDSQSEKIDSSTETKTRDKRGFKKYIKPFIIFLAVLWVIVAFSNNKSAEEMVYELIPEILEEFECGLGYGEPEFPEFKSDKIIITDLEYKQSEYDDVYNMYYVDGSVTITTIFGTQIDLNYQMKVGLDEEFETTGKWYAEIIDGDVFE